MTTSYTHLVNGNYYVLFSIPTTGEKSLSRQKAIKALREKGIRYTINKEACKTPYTGHWAIMIEEDKEEEAMILFFGDNNGNNGRQTEGDVLGDDKGRKDTGDSPGHPSPRVDGESNRVESN